MDMDKILDKKYVLKMVDESATQTAQYMHMVYARLWESRETLSKNLVTLTVAILVGTITFSGNLLTTASSSFAKTEFLFISWGGFLFSVLFGIYSQWKSVTLHSFHARMFNSKPEIEKALDELNPEDDPEKLKKAIGQTVKQITLKITEPIAAADKSVQYALVGQMLSFSIALTLFLIFGIYQVR